MNPVAFFDVDTQFDFMDPAGTLYVRGAETIWPNLKKLTEFAVARRIPVLATADAHPVLDPEFQQFPPHCLKGTPGARRIPETRIDGATVVASGASPKRALPALRGVPRLVLEKQSIDVFLDPAMERVVRAIGARDWVVYGVATDYCVRSAALGLRKRGFEVTVVTDAVKGIAPGDEAKALEGMRKAGVRFLETDVLLAALGRAAKGAAAKGAKVTKTMAAKGAKRAARKGSRRRR
jgi:nicotinamidase/pyrazinamidase